MNPANDVAPRRAGGANRNDALALAHTPLAVMIGAAEYLVHRIASRHPLEHLGH